MKVALTGGIACGKSLFSHMLNELDVETLDADAVVHALEAPGGVGVAPIVARFGVSVRAADGGIDRSALAARVFGSDQAGARRDLEAILHPLVRAALRDFATGVDGARLRVAEIPLLFECDWAGDFDVVCALVSAPELQVARLMETRHLSREEAVARLAAQLPVDEKAARADYVVWNNSTPEHLKAEAEKFVAWLRARV